MTKGGHTLQRISLFELLGRPVATMNSDQGTRITLSGETFDDDGLLLSIEDFGTR